MLKIDFEFTEKKGYRESHTLYEDHFTEVGNLHLSQITLEERMALVVRGYAQAMKGRLKSITITIGDTLATKEEQ